MQKWNGWMLAECARVLMRRWLRALLALILSVGIGVAAYEAIAPSQESNAQILIVPSIKQPGVTGPTNPFVSLNGSISIVASVVQVAVSDQKTAEALAASGARAKYTVAPNLAENAGPVLLITVDDKSAAMTQTTLKAVIDEVSAQLLKIQKDKNVDPDLYLGSVLLTASDHPSPVHKAQVQKAAVAFFGSLVVLVVSILLLERSTMRRQSINAEAAGNGKAPDSDVDLPVATKPGRGSLRHRGRTRATAPGTGRSGSRRAKRGASGGEIPPKAAGSRRAGRLGGNGRPVNGSTPATSADPGTRLAVSNLAKLRERHDTRPGSHALVLSDHSD